MQIIHEARNLQDIAKKLKAQGKKIALVPTMGALHEGHLKLIDKAKTLGDAVFVSVFVNPAQFGKGEDYEKYPREFENDCRKCRERGADAVFAPSVQDMYPADFDTKINCGEITTVLEGKSRPGHFDGVCLVVLKLFNITLADAAVFGQKDAQQVMVIKKMARDLNLAVEIDVHATIREESGLAMSSRNAYLTANEREDAPKIYAGLEKAREFTRENKKSEQVLQFLRNYYAPIVYFTLEYAAITDFFARDLHEIGEGGCVISLAVRTTESKTRLIDNIIV